MEIGDPPSRAWRRHRVVCQVRGRIRRHRKSAISAPAPRRRKTNTEDAEESAQRAQRNPLCSLCALCGEFLMATAISFMHGPQVLGRPSLDRKTLRKINAEDSEERVQRAQRNPLSSLGGLCGEFFMATAISLMHGRQALGRLSLDRKTLRKINTEDTEESAQRAQRNPLSCPYGLCGEFFMAIPTSVSHAGGQWG
jgi:hypothetical protein